MLKKNDFVEIEYTGKVKETGMIFDTTNEVVAKENNFHNSKMKYGPMIVCIGQGQALKGLDKALEGKEVGKDYSVEISAEEGFGKKDPKLVQLIPSNKFKSANIRPVPGLQINVDGQIGTIKTVSGGRCMVDFNHPLTSKDLIYDFKIVSEITDKEKQVSSLAGVMLQMENPKVKMDTDKAVITVPFELPEQASKMISNKLVEVIDGLKEVVFEAVAKPDTVKKKEVKEE